MGIFRRVYMEQPPGYVAQGKNKVCHLKKVIYGLKHSPRAWFKKFSIVISGIVFHLCHSDHSVFGEERRLEEEEEDDE